MQEVRQTIILACVVVVMCLALNGREASVPQSLAANVGVWLEAAPKYPGKALRDTEPLADAIEQPAPSSESPQSEVADPRPTEKRQIVNRRGIRSFVKYSQPIVIPVALTEEDKLHLARYQTLPGRPMSNFQSPPSFVINRPAGSTAVYSETPCESGVIRGWQVMD